MLDTVLAGLSGLWAGGSYLLSQGGPNVIMLLIGIEIMLNAAMLAFVGGSCHWGMADGQVFALMIMAMTSAEVSLALALVVYLHRRRNTVDVDEFRELRD